MCKVRIARIRPASFGQNHQGAIESKQRIHSAAATDGYLCGCSRPQPSAWSVKLARTNVTIKVPSRYLDPTTFWSLPAMRLHELVRRLAVDMLLKSNHFLTRQPSFLLLP
jgi:hypothetical protein